MKALFENVDEIKEKLSKVVTAEQFDRLSEELRSAERDVRIYENQVRLSVEDKARKEFEKAKEKHLALIADFNAVCEELKVDEHDLVQQCFEFVEATKHRADTRAKGKELADTINQNRVKFGTEEVLKPEIYEYQAASREWQSLARAVLERVIDLLNWNTHHDDHVQPLTLLTLQNPLSWGASTMVEEEV